MVATTGTGGSIPDGRITTLYRHHVGTLFHKVMDVKLFQSEFKIVFAKAVFMTDPIVRTNNYDCDSIQWVRAFCMAIKQNYERLLGISREAAVILQQIENEIIFSFPRTSEYNQLFENTTVIQNWLYRRRFTATRERSRRDSQVSNTNWDRSIVNLQQLTMTSMESFAELTAQNLDDHTSFMNVSVDGTRELFTVLNSRITEARANTELISKALIQTEILAKLRIAYERLRSAALLAKRGILSEDLMPMSEVSRMIRETNRKLRSKAPGFRLAQGAEEFYLKPKFSIKRYNYVLFIELFIDVTTFNEASQFRLYQIKSFETAISSNSSHMTRVDNDYKYMLVSPSYWTVSKERPEVSRGAIDFRLLEEPLKSSENKECIYAIFVNDKEMTIKNCRFLIVPYGLKPNAVRLSGRNVLINNVEKYTVECTNTSKEITMSVTQAIIDLACSCGLWSEHFYIPPTFTDCDTDDSFRDIQLVTTVSNLPILSHWLTGDSLNKLMNLNSLMDYAVEMYSEDMKPLEEFLIKMAVVGQNIRQSRFDLQEVSEYIKQTRNVTDQLFELAEVRYQEAKVHGQEKVEEEEEEDTSWFQWGKNILSSVFVVPLTFFGWMKSGFGLSNLFGNGQWLTLIVAVLALLLALRANCVRGIDVTLTRAELSKATDQVFLNISQRFLRGKGFEIDSIAQNESVGTNETSQILPDISSNVTVIDEMLGERLAVYVTLLLFVVISVLMIAFFIYIISMLLQRNIKAIVLELASAEQRILVELIRLPQSLDHYKLMATGSHPIFRLRETCKPSLVMKWEGLGVYHRTLHTITPIDTQIPINFWQRWKLSQIMQQRFCYQLYAVQKGQSRKVHVQVTPDAPSVVAEQNLETEHGCSLIDTDDRVAMISNLQFYHHQTVV